MPAGWLQNYFNTIQTPNTFENKNIIRHKNIHKNIFSLKSGNRQKNKKFDLGRKNNILVEKKSRFMYVNRI